MTDRPDPAAGEIITDLDGYTWEIRADRTVTLKRYEGEDGFPVVPETVADRPVRRIGAGAFAGHPGLRSVILPAGLTAIGDGAFRDCPRLERAAVPPGVRSIGAGVFTGSPVTVTTPRDSAMARWCREKGVACDHRMGWLGGWERAWYGMKNAGPDSL